MKLENLNNHRRSKRRGIQWRVRSIVIAAAVGGAGLALAFFVPKPAQAVVSAEQGAHNPAERLFVSKIQPLLAEKCLACHGNEEKKIKGKFDLRSRETMLKGGESGNPAVVPGEPDKSPLFHAVTRQDDDLAMPPKQADKLTAEQVEWIKQWIAGGAPWPDAARIAAMGNDKWSAEDGVTVSTSGGQSPQWTDRRYKPEDLWAYQPVKKVPVPTLAGEQPKNPVDAFIRQKLAAKGITKPAQQADKLTLLRRTTYDLTGLPPTAGEIDAFLADASPDANNKLVDRLLASPSYGEQFARHWLDVTRYADTSGFANDYERPNAWRYRDYVIRSFNSDKPYDQFVVEQLAGDEIDPANPELLIATGFLRTGPWEATGMTIPAVTRQQYLDDITQGVGVTLLGQGLRCARCHDHKFDPVPTKDYYRIQSVFSSLQFAERPAPFLPNENLNGFAEGKAISQARLDKAEEAQKDIRKKNQAGLAALYKKHGVKKFDELPDDVKKELADKRQSVGLSNLDITLTKNEKKRADYFIRETMRYEPLAFSVYSGPLNDYTSLKVKQPMPPMDERHGAAPAIHILPGGALESPADGVVPGVLSCVYDSNDVAAPTSWNTIPNTNTGRRIAFARWVASPRNTLTSRVIVNRVWQAHFGKGIVATPNNFGKMGVKPTHPELLDYLATWFVENGWSIKKLNRLIMTSDVYREAGEHPELKKLQEVDARNDLLAFYPPHRLAAEEIRDAMLAVTGELSAEAGGPGMFPEINWEVAFQPRHVMGSVSPAYQPSPQRAERNRRSIYAFRYRTLADPMLEVFNRPGSEISCERRDETTVTPQAFSLFNGEFANSRALALAASMQKSANDPSGWISQAFHTLYGRKPNDLELSSCVEHYQEVLKFHQGYTPKEIALPTKIERHMVEELTGEDIGWQEELDVTKHYERDLMPWEASPQTRALAEVCLVLLNSNEFLYVR